MKLEISPKLSVPMEAVTLTTAILAKKGSGKSYTASVMAEEMLRRQQQIVVFDPTGAWWGLKASADGKSAGYPIVVFGGDHADIKLEGLSGELLAEAIVEKGFSAIIDISHMRKTESYHWLAIFIETLYRKNRQALHLFVDEADYAAPQRPQPAQARLLGAMEDIVRRGRIRGIGCTLITQRPQVLNKDVLTQCDILIALRLTHPRDLAPVMEWVRVQADEDQAVQMLKELPSLPIGTAWFWAPAWDMLQKAAIRKRTTFDSGATPKPGQKIIQPKVLATVDIELLGETLKETAERAKADDPNELKKIIFLLKKDLDHALKAKDPKEVIKEIKVPYLDEKMAVHFTETVNELNRISIAIESSILEVKGLIHTNPLRSKPIQITPFAGNKIVIPAHKVTFDEKDLGDPPLSLTRVHRSILTVLAQATEKMGSNQISILSGYSMKSSSFQNGLSSLRMAKYIQGYGSEIMITELGRKNIGEIETLPTGKALLNYWKGKLDKCKSTILQSLYDEPKGLCKDAISQKTGYSVNSSSFQNGLSTLRTLKLAEGYDIITISQTFFE